MNQVIYINLYRSGVYHRQGKPETTNLHGGDVYTSLRAAMEHAEPDRGYVTTIQSVIAVADGMQLAVNNPYSVPTPLSVTRSNNPEALLPYLVPLPAALPSSGPSLDTDEGSTAATYDEWRTRGALARA